MLTIGGSRPPEIEHAWSRSLSLFHVALSNLPTRFPFLLLFIERPNIRSLRLQAQADVKGTAEKDRPANTIFLSQDTATHDYHYYPPQELHCPLW